MNSDKVVTESILDQTLEKHLEGLEERLAVRLITEIEKAKRELDENAREYRDQILTQNDIEAAEHETIRNEQYFIKNDITDLKERVTKLETTSKHS